MLVISSYTLNNDITSFGVRNRRNICPLALMYPIHVSKCKDTDRNSRGYQGYLKRKENTLVQRDGKYNIS